MICGESSSEASPLKIQGVSKDVYGSDTPRADFNGQNWLNGEEGETCRR